MQDSTYSLVCSPMEGLIFSPSSEILTLVIRLSHNKEFASRVYSCRKLLNLRNIFAADLLKRKGNFDEHLKLSPPDIQREYLKILDQIITDFDLPRNLLPTLNYLIGTGLIFKPHSPIKIWKERSEVGIWGGVDGFNILVMERMSISDLIKQIKLKADEISKEMEKLPKIKKPIHHKDGLRIGGLIAVWKDSMGRTNKEIADLLSTFEEDDYRLFGANKPICLSEKEVAIYYLRHKRENKYVINTTKV